MFDNIYDIFEPEQNSLHPQNNLVMEETLTTSAKSTRKVNYNDVIITSISQPEHLGASSYYLKKKYLVRISFYKKGQTSKELRTVTVTFGNNKKEDYIDNKNSKIKLLRQYQCYEQRFNPFNDRFWVYHLLNNKETVRESYYSILEMLGLI